MAGLLFFYRVAVRLFSPEPAGCLAERRGRSAWQAHERRSYLHGVVLRVFRRFFARFEIGVRRLGLRALVHSYLRTMGHGSGWCSQAGPGISIIYRSHRALITGISRPH